jgi:uncharacterized protein (DUF1499 family)
VAQVAWWVGIVLAVLVAAGFLSIVVRNLLATRPRSLGLVDGRLRPCPGSPNCVCTQDADAQHAIGPLRFSGTPGEAVARLRAAIESLPRTRIVTDTGGYLHVEFTTRLMRFVDDVEFAVDPKNKVIDFRSASRIGYSDLGTNRRRMEAVRAAYEAAQ